MNDWSPRDDGPTPPPGRWRKLLRRLPQRHGRRWLLGLAVVFLLAITFADALLARPMRGWAERTMNANLKGYEVRIARVRPHLWRLGLDLDGMTLLQVSHPDPPVADIGSLRFSVQFTELLRLKVAGDLTILRPALHINLAQIEAETSSDVRLRDRGWQRAVESIFPFKLDRVMVQDGSLLYLSSHEASKPLQLTHVTLIAQNLRNIAAAKRTYPSPVRMEGVLFDSGKVWFDGHADFLREPFVGAQGKIRLLRVPLDRLTPIAQQWQLKTTGGFLSAEGWAEYTPEGRKAHLSEVLFEDLRVDYVTSPATKALEREHAKVAIRLAKRVRDAPKLLLRIDRLDIKRSQIGFENQGTQPPYRLFMSEGSLEVANLSNRVDLGRTTFHGRGTFMGSGTASVSGGAQAAAHSADVDVHLELEDARLPDLNGFLLAHTGMDVAEGQFSVYSEISVKEGRVEGYIKPLVRNLKMSEKGKDREKSMGKRVEMHLLQFLSRLLKNHSTQDVATVIRISGTIHDLKAGEWEAIRKAIWNGLFKGIRPGLGPEGKAEPPKPSTAGGAGST